MLDPFRLLVATLPLGLYLLRVAILSLRGKPTVVSGVWEATWFGFGLSGLMMIGPIELFAPDTAFVAYGPYAWLMLLVMYGLCVSLYVLVQPPTLYLYNTTTDEAAAILTRAIGPLDPQAQQAGSTIVLPALDLEVRVETFATTRNVRLAASSVLQPPSTWQQFDKALRTAIEASPSIRSGLAAWITLGVAMWLLSVAGITVKDHAPVIGQTLMVLWEYEP